MHAARLFRMGMDVDRNGFVDVRDFWLGHCGIHRSGGVGKSFKLILLHNEHGKLGCNRPCHIMPFSGPMFALKIAGNKKTPAGENTMGQAEPFETDFWKDASLRKVWDGIVPGEPRKT